MSQAETGLSSQNFSDLQWAHQHLEHPSFAGRLSHLVGTPIEAAFYLLPKDWHRRLQAAVEISIRKTLDIAITSMGTAAPAQAHDRLHKLMATGAGAVGGFFGPITLFAELPLTTTLMLRSIADIAHSQGEDLSTMEGRLACMQVFALGGRTGEDQAAETGYYSLRIMLGVHFENLANYTGNIADIPAAISMIRTIAARFGVVVSDKTAAQMVPIVGALSGALLNLIFMQHFQDIARGHFIIRRLEREYGSETIRVEFERLTRQEKEAEKEFSPLEGW